MGSPLGRAGPRQQTPFSAATAMRWIGACVRGSSRMFSRRNSSTSSYRVSGPRSARMRPIALMPFAFKSVSSPSCACRARLAEEKTGPSSPSNQRTSSAATRWSVPRISQVRTIDRSSISARVTSASRSSVPRARKPSAAASKTWACRPQMSRRIRSGLERRRVSSVSRWARARSRSAWSSAIVTSAAGCSRLHPRPGHPGRI